MNYRKYEKGEQVLLRNEFRGTNKATVVNDTEYGRVYVETEKGKRICVYKHKILHHAN